jgi:hypothetical protein
MVVSPYFFCWLTINGLPEKGRCSVFITALRHLEEIMEERGVNVDHATLNRWVIRYAPTIAAKAHSQKRTLVWLFFS